MDAVLVLHLLVQFHCEYNRMLSITFINIKAALYAASGIDYIITTRQVCDSSAQITNSSTNNILSIKWEKPTKYQCWWLLSTNDITRSWNMNWLHHNQPALCTDPEFALVRAARVVLQVSRRTFIALFVLVDQEVSTSVVRSFCKTECNSTVYKNVQNSTMN